MNDPADVIIMIILSLLLTLPLHNVVEGRVLIILMFQSLMSELGYKTSLIDLMFQTWKLIFETERKMLSIF